MLVRAAAARAHETDGVGVIDHHQRSVRVGEIADRREVCEVAVHREHAICHNENAPRALGCLELRSKIGHVVVLVTETLGFAEAHTVDDGGVVELIGNDRVIRAEQCLEQSAVGVEARGVKDRVLHPEEIAELVLELLVDGLRAADEAHTRQAVAPFIERIAGGFDHLRMTRQPEVIIRAHVQHRALAHAHPCRLRCVDHPLSLVEAGRADFVQLGLQLVF